MPLTSFERERQEKERARESWHRAAKAVRAGKDRVKSVLSRSLATVGSLFEIMDYDGSGAIDAEEFHRAVLALGVQAPKEVTDSVFADFDFDGSGEIGSTEFVRFMLRDALSSSSTRVMDLFKKWDTDGSGELDFKEFQEAIVALGFVIPHHELVHVFEEIDTDNSGTVSFQELHRQLRQGSAVQLAKKLKPGRAGVIEVEKRNRAYSLRGDLHEQAIAARRPTTVGPGLHGPGRTAMGNAQLSATSGSRAMTAPGAPRAAMSSRLNAHFPDDPMTRSRPLPPLIPQAEATLKQASSRSYLLAPSMSYASTIPRASTAHGSSRLSNARSVGRLDSASTTSQSRISGMVVENCGRQEKTQDERAKVATKHRAPSSPVVYRHKLLRGTRQRWVEPLPSITTDRQPIWTWTAFPPPPARLPAGARA